jgi:DNA-binding CsgD family transcriptional regulator
VSAEAENIMTTSEMMTRWNQSLAKVINSDFDVEALREFVTALESLARGASSTIIVYPDDTRPYVAYQRLLPEEDPKIHIDHYVSGPYLVDPCYVHAREVGEEGFFLIGELAPEGFQDSEYHRLYYHAVGLKDEACYIFRLRGGEWAIISLGRHSEDSLFSAQDRALLSTLFPVAKAICNRWVQAREVNTGEQNLEVHLDAALKNFGTSVLTPRESMVLNLLLQGHSIKSIAQRLENSLETIKSHRKKIYSKLDVSTQAELFHVFIDSLRSAIDPGKDPLIAYMSLDGVAQ